MALHRSAGTATPAISLHHADWAISLHAFTLRRRRTRFNADGPPSGNRHDPFIRPPLPPSSSSL
jgi:hypothetical protein